MGQQVSTESYYDIDLGSKFAGEADFLLNDWETAKTTQFMTSEERDDLYKKHYGLCEARAAHFVGSNGKYDFDEITSQAIVGFVEALNGYDPRRGAEQGGASFVTYAYKCITTAILRHLKKVDEQRKHEVLMDDEIAEDNNGHVASLADTLEDDEPNVQEDIEKEEIITSLINMIKHQLNHDDFYILTHLYGLGGEQIMTQQEIADTLGMSQANVSKKYSHAHLALKIMMEGTYGPEIKSYFTGSSMA